MGRLILDEILVVDVEATCWPKTPPEGQKNDIIEIGIVLLNCKALTLSGKRSILVRPERSVVSEFCTRLTTLTAEEVGKGISFAQACEILTKEYRSHKRVWASYGEYDRKIFRENCTAFGIPYPFGKSHLNIKPLFAAMMGKSYEVGMVKTLEITGLSLEGTHHRGDDDAWNTARILAKLLGSGRTILE